MLIRRNRRGCRRRYGRGGLLGIHRLHQLHELLVDIEEHALRRRDLEILILLAQDLHIIIHIELRRDLGLHRVQRAADADVQRIGHASHRAVATLVHVRLGDVAIAALGWGDLEPIALDPHDRDLLPAIHFHGGVVVLAGAGSNIDGVGVDRADRLELGVLDLLLRSLLSAQKRQWSDKQGGQ